ncbi:hypothetical protein [Bacillus sp. SD088]|uniref:hypothetical protein n=1 Tax=Bacillus sp. SD088 TaxID=2782012 RepID=UPI001A969C9C|nr:hypothetical protein [Bacillus sp. SD088]MBO0995891.1 hypothetical protein [Bacillus sp. SD088]
MSGYVLKIDEAESQQKESDHSFIGGQPRLPEDRPIPHCQLCGAEQTLFFQVAFPEGHLWEGLTMAVFHCTSCAHEGERIPEILPVPLKGANIPKGFLESYQRNFKIEIFATKEGVIRRDYQENIQFKRWILEAVNGDPEANKVGGKPNWLLEDEAPATYDGKVPMFFLMQLMEDFQFELVEDAPPQMQIGLRGDPEPSQERYYELFLANQLYFFGTEEKSDPLVYVLTQI